MAIVIVEKRRKNLSRQDGPPSKYSIELKNMGKGFEFALNLDVDTSGVDGWSLTNNLDLEFFGLKIFKLRFIIL